MGVCVGGLSLLLQFQTEGKQKKKNDFWHQNNLLNVLVFFLLFFLELFPEKLLLLLMAM